MDNLNTKNQKGSILVTILTVMIFLSIMVMSLASLVSSNVLRARGRVLLLQAQYTAESGADVAIAYLNSDPTASYTGTSSDVTVLTTSRYKAKFSTTVTAGTTSKQRIITAIGKVYAPATASTPTYTRKIRFTAERSSTTSSFSLASRNIIYVESGVKNLEAKDIYANGFVQLNKNTTNLIAETITVVGKNTGASNCSIGGSGNLIKPSTFTTPGLTKTSILTGYNNCLSPPGNTSNANFNVSANQSNISTIASTYIPWSQYMSTTAQSRSCNDWSANLLGLGGPQTHTIPSAGSGDTHYPDSGSNTSLSCGVLGDLYLGSDRYNLNGNVHIRASLCVVQVLGCKPSFYNPDPNTIRWVFVEGAIDFNSVQTISGSGPIVFVVYGADPITQILNCPYGGAAYLGNSGSTSAPAAYFLAMNGVCIDKTKFSSTPALGGLSGKNIYIASNPGTPFDLKLDPLFPADQIPVDLSWRATSYERL
jgi:hypothetical protein